MSGYKEFTFHEEGRTFTWSPASRVVRTEAGGVVLKNCMSLRLARAAAQSYIRSIERREEGRG